MDTHIHIYMMCDIYIQFILHIYYIYVCIYMDGHMCIYSEY